MKIVITENQFRMLESLISDKLLTEQLITKLLGLAKNTKYLDDVSKIDPGILKLGKNLESEFGGEFKSLLTSLSRVLNKNYNSGNFVFKGVTIPERKMNTILSTIIGDKADRVLKAKLMDNLKKIELPSGESLGSTLETVSKNVPKNVGNVVKKTVSSDAEKFLSDIKTIGVKRMTEDDITDLINYYKLGEITADDLANTLKIIEPSFGDTWSALKEYDRYRKGLNKKEGYLSFDEWVIKQKKYNLLNSKLKKLGAKSGQWFTEPAGLIFSNESDLIIKGLVQALMKTAVLGLGLVGVPVAVVNLLYKLGGVSKEVIDISSAGVEVATEFLKGTEVSRREKFKDILTDKGAEMVLPDKTLVNIYSSTSEPKPTYNLNQNLMGIQSETIGFSNDAIILKDGVKIYDNNGIAYDTFQISKDGDKIIVIGASESSTTPKSNEVDVFKEYLKGLWKTDYKGDEKIEYSPTDTIKVDDGKTIFKFKKLADGKYEQVN